jgi:hypothetical protein
MAAPNPAGPKIFWFFFSKKNGLLALLLVVLTRLRGFRHVTGE